MNIIIIIVVYDMCSRLSINIALRYVMMFAVNVIAHFTIISIKFCGCLGPVSMKNTSLERGEWTQECLSRATLTE